MPVVEIPLRGGVVALVDDVDVPLVSGHAWRPMRRGHAVYAVRGRCVDGRYESLLMHRVVLGITDSNTQVDHKNGNGLDNRRLNLRACSRSENHRNARRYASNRTGYKGVGFNPRLNRFNARIFRDGKAVYLGSFETAEEAHAAYRRAATEAFGEFARFE